MLTFNPNEIFNLNKLGIIVACVISVFIIFYPFSIWIILLLEVILASYVYYLYMTINRVKLFSIYINSENKWFIKNEEQMSPVELKDYWIQTGRVFIWLKGSKNSVSFVVSRSIIGAQKFSQLRARIQAL